MSQTTTPEGEGAGRERFSPGQAPSAAGQVSCSGAREGAAGGQVSCLWIQVSCSGGREPSSPGQVSCLLGQPPSFGTRLPTLLRRCPLSGQRWDTAGGEVVSRSGGRGGPVASGIRAGRRGPASRGDEKRGRQVGHVAPRAPGPPPQVKRNHYQRPRRARSGAPYLSPPPCSPAFHHTPRCRAPGRSPGSRPFSIHSLSTSANPAGAGRRWSTAIVRADLCSRGGGRDSSAARRR